MNQQQIDLVQRTFRHIMPIGDTAAEVFYRRLFSLDPSLRAMFSGDMREQGRKLIQMLAVVVQGLSNLESVLPAIEDLGRRHAGYGVRPEHYDTVGEALLSTLSVGLGDVFTVDVRESWRTAYRLLADTMQRAATETTKV